MHHLISPLLFAGFLISTPVLVSSIGFLPTAQLNRKPVFYSTWSYRLALVGLVFALVSVGLLIRTAPLDYHLKLFSVFPLGIYFDNLSAVVWILISFLLTIILRYSIHYMMGDPNQGRFTKWLCFTGGSVMILVISGNMIQFTLSWVFTSLCLHQLLEFYPDRPGALLAARKKFLISRLGDACLIGVIFWVYGKFHTWNFVEIFQKIEDLKKAHQVSQLENLNLLGFLIVLGAMLKSAQFPFHSWLPDTMETPTPVSALMHAGIINAGGFLVIRMAPLLSLSHPAMGFLAFFGALTALFGSLVMLTHSSIKRVLAFSTMAQMGFMMLECGLGAFSLALLHLASHSLYKAYAFLSSGTLKSTGMSFLRPIENGKNQRMILIFCLFSAFLVTLSYAQIFKIQWITETKSQILLALFSLSISFYLWNIWSQKFDLLYFFSGILGVLVIGLTYFQGHRIFDHYILSNYTFNYQPSSMGDYLILAFLMFSFLFVLVLQIELPKKSHSPNIEALYVHARNGFYFNTWLNRGVQSIWPVSQKRFLKKS